MNTPLKLSAFALGLAAVFGAALGVGAAVGPDPSTAEAADHGADAEEHGGEATHTGESPAEELPAGLLVSEAGYTLDLAEDALPAGTAAPVSFRILGPDGAPVTAFDVEHEEDLHLVAVRRDLDGFQHVHPTLGAGGVWTTTLDLTAGAWRLFADFVPSADGENRILGADLAVAGSFDPAPLPAPTATAEVDGYTVVLSGQLEAGTETELQLSVSRDGVPVTDLQPYLGAYGHLVVLRAGDLGYLHVHPLGEPGDPAVAPGPHVEFATTAPSAGTYRLFLDFRHGDTVRTAAFTVTVPEEAGP
ncbi:hypothetical protein GCM10010531_10170 [Blastococcus jejuensis]|uniref:Secreted protein n=1 Tax=Blastococcus jejuensis TaxID=351224 RepID=A0ABP6P274_9ACTN